MKIRYEDVQDSEEIHSYIRKADESLIALGYTEHSFAHVTKVADTSRRILLALGYPEREAELAAIAGYLHDIGNVINRVDTAQSGAIMAFRSLDHMTVAPDDLSIVPGEEIGLVLTIDTAICSVMDYFEIFLGRMILCRKAAEKLGLHFTLTINGQKML